MTITEHMQARTMCLSFCYAGRSGHCASAGTKNNQVKSCLAMFQREQKAGVV